MPVHTAGLRKQRTPAEAAARRAGAQPAEVLPFEASLAYVFRNSGGKATAINAARLLEADDPRFKRFIYRYDSLSDKDKDRIRLEDLCESSEITPNDFLAAVVPALWRRNVDIGKAVAAISHPKVVEATIEAAVTGGTFGAQDRKMLFEHIGFLPTKNNGFSVTIDNSHKTLIAGGGGGLPPFEDTAQAASTIIRDGQKSLTSQKLLQPVDIQEAEIVQPGQD